VHLHVKGRNVDVPDSLRVHVVEKLTRLDRHLDRSARVEVELAVERNPAIAENQLAEATVWTKGPVLRARESSTDMRTAIDHVADKLERQVIRYREKRRRPRSTAAFASDGAGGARGGEPQIVKRKQFAVKPMTAEEAVLQLELVGHDFFVFRDAESDAVNVVYRRRDGDYGLIETGQG
jgi:putative sigma-54 modulation protein